MARSIRQFLPQLTTIVTLLLLIGALLHCDRPSAQRPLYPLRQLVRPSLGMFGDSTLAFWPAEEMLSDFHWQKFAFPLRTTADIDSVARNSIGNFDACLYSGGINDFLANYAPTESAIEATVDRQAATLAYLRTRCSHLLAIAPWAVEFPWPVSAADALHDSMYRRSGMPELLDGRHLIHKTHLIDGGHLTEEGYRVLSLGVRRYYHYYYGEFIPAD